MPSRTAAPRPLCRGRGLRHAAGGAAAGDGRPAVRRWQLRVCRAWDGFCGDARGRLLVMTNFDPTSGFTMLARIDPVTGDRLDLGVASYFTLSPSGERFIYTGPPTGDVTLVEPDDRAIPLGGVGSSAFVGEVLYYTTQHLELMRIAPGGAPERLATGISCLRSPADGRAAVAGAGPNDRGSAGQYVLHLRHRDAGGDGRARGHHALRAVARRAVDPDVRPRDRARRLHRADDRRQGLPSRFPGSRAAATVPGRRLRMAAGTRRGLVSRTAAIRTRRSGSRSRASR